MKNKNILIMLFILVALFLILAYENKPKAKPSRQMTKKTRLISGVAKTSDMKKITQTNRKGTLKLLARKGPKGGKVKIRGPRGGRVYIRGPRGGRGRVIIGPRYRYRYWGPRVYIGPRVRYYHRPYRYAPPPYYPPCTEEYCPEQYYRQPPPY